MDRRLLLLALVTMALYWPTLGYGYVYEDKNDLEAFARPWPLSGDVVGDALRHPTRLLRDVSFAIGGTSEKVAHLGNFALHVMNGFLLYVLAVSLMPAPAAVFAVGLFWLHPVQVESVAYISSRSDLVAVFCTLLAALAWRRPWVCLAMALGAVFAKETFAAVLLLPLIVGSWNRANRSLWFVWGVVTAPIVLYGLMAFGARASLEPVVYGFTQLSSLLTLWVLPVGLTIDHDWALLTPMHVMLCLLIWMVLVSVAFVAGFPRWSWALGLIVIFFLPRLLVPAAEGLHEHHLYFPSVALSLYGGWCAKGFV
jgi:hypothetical protein